MSNNSSERKRSEGEGGLGNRVAGISTHHSRDALIDALRGICVASMLIKHLGAGDFASRMSLSGSVGFFSGAEGFFFLSGFIFSRVYRRRTETKGPAVATRLMLKRWFHIYSMHFLCVAAACACAPLMPAAFLGLKEDYALFVNSPIKAFFLGSALIYQPHMLGIVPMYLVFIPIAGGLILRGWERSHWVPLVAILLWALQLGEVRAHLDVFTAGNRISMLAAYQMLFFVGTWIGSQSLEKPVIRVHPALALLCVAVVGGCFVALHPRYFGLNQATVDAMTAGPSDKLSMGWLRVLNFSAAAYLVYYYSSPLRKLPLAMFAALGRNSLGIFVGHIVFTYVFCQVNLVILGVGQMVYNFFIMSCLAVMAVALWQPKLPGAAQRGQPKGSNPNDCDR